MSGRRDYRDGVIEQQADENAALREHVAWWRAFALAVLERLSEQGREIQMIDQREYVHRTRTQDERDAWVDQTDLRLETA